MVDGMIAVASDGVNVDGEVDVAATVVGGIVVSTGSLNGLPLPFVQAAIIKSRKTIKSFLLIYPFIKFRYSGLFNGSRQDGGWSYNKFSKV